MNLSRYTFLISFLLIMSFQLRAQEGSDRVPRPKLVVGIMVDQMRADYLYRYYDRYGEGGFKRMLKEGFSNDNTYINHIPTVTGIGHSTVWTGTVPAVHGITGNSFSFNSTGERTNCVGDESVESVGTESSSGKRSPTHLMVTTVGDELKLATNFRSKVIGISLKDRGAILPAGHSADAAYWFQSTEGRWISSTYYMDQLPQWVTQFNGQNRAKQYLDQDWNTLYDINTYTQSSADDVPWEGKPSGKDSPTFPYELSKMYKEDDYGTIYNTPYGNSILVDFAKEAIEKEQLGQRGETDLLAMSFSSTDGIGHRYGPNSIEIEDTYLRLDRDLEDFFKYLDDKIGEGNYTVFLTADHGAEHNSQFLAANKIKVNPMESSIQKDLNELLFKEFRVENLVRSLGYAQVHFDYQLIEKYNIDEQEVRDVCMQYLRRNPEVIFAVDMHNVGNASVPEEILIRIKNGHHPDRSGAIQLIFNPNTQSLSSTGVGHSDWNPYDAKIPLVWMGWGIKKGGRSVKQSHMIDIAPTLASLLRITPPNGNIGKALEETMNDEDL